MAGPSSIVERDSLVAMRMQLMEAGAGDVSIASLIDLPQHKEPEPAMQQDASLACDLTAADLSVARDAAYAHFLARQEAGHVSGGPSSAPPASVMMSNLALPPVKCSICLELTPSVSRFVSHQCGHSFCLPCIRQHLVVVATETHKFPVVCPQCQVDPSNPPATLDSQDCLAALAGTGAAYNALERLVLERQHFGSISYCANGPCSVPFDWVDDPANRRFSDRFKVRCPFCTKNTCVQCKVLWHEGQTCTQYVEEKNNTDALARLAREKAWRPCPKCKAMIERQQGDCNFVKCRCGCGFCHNCGEEYASLRQTMNNTHGRPNCTCGLFGNGLVADQAVAAPAAAQMAAPAAAQAAVPVAVPAGPIHRDEVVQDFMRARVRAMAEMAVNNLAADDVRDEFEYVTEGDNGYLSLGSWMQGVGPRNKRLPPSMHTAVGNNTCPYDECRREFADLMGLEQHLVSVQRHDVYLCCGRPFKDENAYGMHQEAMHL